jgi:hypothetical protein
MTNEYKTYTCSYPFSGSHWGFELKARTLDEAEERRKALAWSKVDGEVVITIGAATIGSVNPAGVKPDLIERAFLTTASGLFRVLNGYVRLRNRLLVNP